MQAATVRLHERPSPPRIRPRAVRERPAPAVTTTPFDRDYWIAHCEGYRVDGAEGRLGLVKRVRATDEPHGRVTIVVRAGLLGRRSLHVPGSEVAFIVPREQRIWLRSPDRDGVARAPDR